MIMPVAWCHLSGVIPSLRECLKMCNMHGEIVSQLELIIACLMLSGPGDLFLGISLHTLLSFCGVISLFITVSCSASCIKVKGSAGSSFGKSAVASASSVSFGDAVDVPFGSVIVPSSGVGVFRFLRKLWSFAADGRLLILSV